MRVVKQLGLALVAVLALGAIAVSSASAAPTFLAHNIGGLLLASAGSSTQIFTVPVIKQSVECTALKLLPPDTTTALQFLRILVVVDYENCKIAGLLNAVVHPVKYLIDANGLVTVENDVLILAAEGCKITVPAAKNQSLTTVAFENTTANRGILLLANVKGITSSGEGGPAGLCAYGEESNGTYTGTIHLKLDNTNPLAVLRWDP